jgi:hypothetical protein
MTRCAGNGYSSLLKMTGATPTADLQSAALMGSVLWLQNHAEELERCTGFVIPVPEEKMEAYRKWAENGAAIFREHGCIEIVDSWEDNVPSGKYTDFRRAVDAKDGEKKRLLVAGVARQGDPRFRRSKNARGRAFGGFG